MQDNNKANLRKHGFNFKSRHRYIIHSILILLTVILPIDRLFTALLSFYVLYHVVLYSVVCSVYCLISKASSLLITLRPIS